MKLLLTSVFKPFGINDDLNSSENPMEQLHSSSTRMQGVFSVHAHNRSFGLTLMAENLKTPTTVLDFPTLEEFKAEIAKGYTHVGISFIVPNVEKAEIMAKYVRRTHPEIKIFIGGHGAQIPGIEKIVPCDDACRMEGISWIRTKMGEDPDAPFNHPIFQMEVWRKVMGIPVPPKKAVIVPGVGCSNGCNFCSTSHYFQGYKPYFKSTKELFDSMVKISDSLRTNDFQVFDENFLEDENRIYELIELMEKNNRPFTFDIFSSLRSISKFSPRDIARLGIQFLWIGIETKRPLYKKTEGLNAKEIFAKFRKYGVSFLASSIFFFDHHDRQTLWEDVDYTLSLDPDFVFLTTLSPCPGTPLWDQYSRQDRILPDVPLRERTGQGMIWFKHPVFSPNETRKILNEAYLREYQTLGPCLMRYARTKLEGYKTLRALNDPVFENRVEQMRVMAKEMIPLLYSFERFAPNSLIADKAKSLREDFKREFGPMSLADGLGTLIVHGCAHIENGRIKRGLKLQQPKTFIDRYRQSN
ncbi:MAG: radical SAM protein [Candidatus Riflebacteria bacterium]|nr:radical SAM protein [Candidatus Riflebacteria bacterium]